jgi:hypothetical protein
MTAYTAKMADDGTLSVYLDGVRVAEKVHRADAFLFQPAHVVTVRLPDVGTVEARLVPHGDELNDG